jgi:hypothetical protein
VKHTVVSVEVVKAAEVPEREALLMNSKGIGSALRLHINETQRKQAKGHRTSPATANT